MDFVSLQDFYFFFGGGGGGGGGGGLHSNNMVWIPFIFCWEEDPGVPLLHM